MQISPDGFFHLTYCTKVHPGCGLERLFGNLRTLVPPLKARLSPEGPFGLGLRLSEAESRDLLAGDNLARWQEFLAEHRLYVFTLNGFPYGDLAGQVVKEEIFAPDWRTRSRLEYTLRLVEILARLLPPGLDGSISTVPLSYRSWIAADAAALEEITARLVQLTQRLIEVEAETGKLIHLDLEPEPDGALEHSGEVVEFYRNWLLTRGAADLARSAGLGVGEARLRLLRHLRVCLDTCHLAVAFEEPAAALDALAREGIQIGKVQVTAGLQVMVPASGRDRASLARQLAPFTRSPYLHQVITREDGGRGRRFPDLWQALALLDRSPREQWRIHYHMPLFVERFGDLAATTFATRQVLRLLKDRQFCPHLEIETYTWEWLPPELKRDLLESLTAEYRWVLEAMGEADQSGAGQASSPVQNSREAVPLNDIPYSGKSRNT